MVWTLQACLCLVAVFIMSKFSNYPFYILIFYPFLLLIGVNWLIFTQDEKSGLQYIFNPVPKCKCCEGNKFAIVQIWVRI